MAPPLTQAGRCPKVVEQAMNGCLPTRDAPGQEEEERYMTRTVVFASFLFCAAAPLIRAQDPCSNADLTGGYSFVASGTFGDQTFAAAGQTTYDGVGGAKGLIQISLNGGSEKPAVTPVIGWTATYTVDPATCTATKTMVVPGVGTLHFFITAANGFADLRFIATDVGTAISGTAGKQSGSQDPNHSR